MSAIMSGPEWYLHDAVAQLTTLIEAANFMGDHGLADRCARIRQQVVTARVMLDHPHPGPPGTVQAS